MLGDDAAWIGLAAMRLVIVRMLAAPASLKVFEPVWRTISILRFIRGHANERPARLGGPPGTSAGMNHVGFGATRQQAFRFPSRLLATKPTLHFNISGHEDVRQIGEDIGLLRKLQAPALPVQGGTAFRRLVVDSRSRGIRPKERRSHRR